jgi:hypothetical protein
MADFNADRRVDAYCYHSGSASVDVAFSNGSNAFVSQGTWKTSWYCAPGGGVTNTVGDVDGDGRADLVCHNGTGSGSGNGYTWVALNGGTSFGTTQTWQAPTTFAKFCGVSNAKFAIADIDGDGRGDAWCFDNTAGNTYVALSRGAAFFDPYNDPLNVGVPPVPWLGGGWCAASWSTIDFGMADFNSDGFADLYCHNKSNGNVYLALGRGQFLPAASGGNTWVPSGQPVGGFRYIYTSSLTSSLGSPVTSFCTTSLGSTAQFGVGDFDGDGESDMYCHYNDVTQVNWTRSYVTAGANSGGPDWCTSSLYSFHYWGTLGTSTIMSGWCDTRTGLVFRSAN